MPDLSPDVKRHLAGLLLSSGVGMGAGALGGGEGNRLRGAGAGILGGTLGGAAGESLLSPLAGSNVGRLLGSGIGGYQAGKATKESSMSPINQAFDIGKQRALKEAGYDTVEEVIKEAQALGLYEEPSKTAAAVDTNALAELRARLK